MPEPRCQLPPDGWYCTRTPGHDGPCAAWETPPDPVWATVWQILTGRQCRARKEPDPLIAGGGFYGRCEQATGHPGDHALERGFDTPRWSTDWTA